MDNEERNDERQIASSPLLRKQQRQIALLNAQQPQPLTGEELDKFLADLDPEFDAMAVKAQAEYNRLYKVPVPRFIHLRAIIGGLMFSGSILFLIWWLYPIYQKLLGGTR